MPEAFKRPRKKHGVIAVFLMAILISLLFGFLVFNGVGLIYTIIAFFVVFSICMPILWTFQYSKSERSIKNNIGIVEQVQEVQYTKKDEKTGREVMRLPTYLREVDFQKYLEGKGQNRNIAIAGMARSGKTYLLYWILSQLSTFETESGTLIPLHRIVFQAKDSDRFCELGIPSLYLSKVVPNVFLNPNAFLMSWRLAFSLNNMGITALRIEPKLLEIVKRIRANPSWEAFNKELQKMLTEEKSNITAEALNTINNVFRAVAYEDNTENFRKMADIELPDSIVLNFAGLNNFAFAFFAEYLLRQLDAEIENGKREGTSVMVDEAHIFNREGSIIPRISAVIASRGSLIVATQELHTIEGQLKGNCATQFCFKQTEPKDLNVASALSEPYHWIVQRLYPYEFVDLAQEDSHKGIYVFRLINPSIEFQPIEEWIPEGVKQTGKEQKAEKIDYEQEILHALEHAKNVQDIAKFLSKKIRNSDKKEDISYFKLKIKDTLARMVVNQSVIAERTDNVKFNSDKDYVVSEVVFCRKSGNPSDYHEYLVNSCAEVLYKKGIIFKIMPSGVGTADIEAEKFVLEIETGLKNDITDIEGRIKKYKKEGKETFIIVPNEDAKAKYQGKYPETKILTLPELWNGEGR